MGSAGVQLRGINAVMAAYDNIKIIAWSVMYGRNINMKYVGLDETQSRAALRDFLDLLKASDTVAVYTLNLYEDLPKGSKITSKTEADYSFNFLVEETEAPRYARYRDIDQRTQSLMDEVTALKAQLAMKEEDDDEPEQGIGAVINGILGDPSVKEWIRQKAIGWADKLITGSPQPVPANVIPMNQQAQKIGAITADDPVLIDEVQQQRMQQALEILARIDKNLGDNLLKLARIAENDPGKYSVMAKML